MGSHSVTCHPAEVTFPPCSKRYTGQRTVPTYAVIVCMNFGGFDEFGEFGELG